MMTIADRNKYAFVTICRYGLLLLLLRPLSAATTTAFVAAAAVTTSAEPGAQPQAAITAEATTTQDEVNAGPGAGAGAGAGADAATVRTFSPRMDYNNEWRPLGHGDPLKNDPTYDYSPPALDRVRYWAAENGGASGGSSGAGGSVDKNANKEQNKTKNEILLLGVSNERERERVRGQPHHPQQHPQQHSQQHPQQHPQQHHEAPLLQPKYTSIRRSYYAQQPHQMPHTHLMPPPMYQAAAPPPHPPTPPPPQQMMKLTGSSVDHRYNSNMGNYMMASTTAGHQHMLSSSTAMHSKPYYSTAATSPWLHHSTAHMPHASDAQHLESMQHYSFARPGPAATSYGGGSSMATTQVIHTYSPNAIYSYGPTGSKQSTTAARKPWLHELLQKELVKPPKHMSSGVIGTRPHYDMMTPSFGVGGISTTYAPITYTPVTFVSAPPTIATKIAATPTPPPRPLPTTDSQAAVYITPTPYTTPASPNSETGFRPMIPTPTTSSNMAIAPTQTPPPASTTNSRLLFIPTMSNLAYRPTVAPLELTTDALFKHYKQPKKPLVGPMYLIIEGHSKVKTYGQNELDPHQPKIVPIIPKREPVIRIADPNERRGTVETFQVKHLHTTSTTPLPPTSTTTASTTTTTTMRPTTITTKTPLPQQAELTSGGASFSSTGLQSMLSLLDIFTDTETGPESQLTPAPIQTPRPKLSVNPAGSTVLRPVTTTKPGTTTSIKSQEPEPRISSKADTISSILDDTEASSEAGTTEQPLRGTRQVFDYDQLPESRLKELPVDDDAAYDYEEEPSEDDEAAEEATTADEPTAESDDVEEGHKLLKRIDSFLDDDDVDVDADDDDDDNDVDNVEEELAESNELDDLADLAAGLEDVTT